MAPDPSAPRAIVAGVGVPQITAIQHVAEALKYSGIPCIADGRHPLLGRHPKADRPGASGVMPAAFFAGSEGSGREIELFQGRSYKSYRGMGSLGRCRRARATATSGRRDESRQAVPEGSRAASVQGTAPQSSAADGRAAREHGLHRCRTIDDMRGKAEFVRSLRGMRESHVHDVQSPRKRPITTLNEVRGTRHEEKRMTSDRDLAPRTFPGQILILDSAPRSRS